MPGDGRRRHSRFWAHHSPWRRQDRFSRPAAVLAAGYVAAGPRNGAPAGQVRDRIFALLRELNLEQIVIQAGGLDAERDWGTLLSLSEQQLAGLVHILLAAPQFVFLDRLGATLSPTRSTRSSMLAESSITYVNIGDGRPSRDLYDAILECSEDGAWVWTAEPAAAMLDADAPRRGLGFVAAARPREQRRAGT